MYRKPFLNLNSIIVALLLLLLLSSCRTQIIEQEDAFKVENPNLDPLTPEQVVEYIDIFYLECDKTTEQILAGEDYVLTATDETADLLMRINFFTNGLHTNYNKAAEGEVLERVDRTSSEFYNAYVGAQNAKDKYTGHLTAHWMATYPSLLVEHIIYYPPEIYWFYKNIPEEILRRVYIVVDDLPLMQYIFFLNKYELKWDKGLRIEYDGTGNIIRQPPYLDPSGLFGTDGSSEERIAYINELFWTNPRYQKEKELMIEYGFSDDNPMTFEWVVSHPKEAYTLVTTTWSPDSGFVDRSFLLEDLERFRIPIFPPDDDDM